MTEILRQHYLAGIGIDSYSPRFLFSISPSPFLCETGLYFEDQVVAEEAFEQPSYSVSALNSVSTDVEGLLQSLRGIEVRSSAPSPEEVSIIAQPLSDSVTPFILSYWRPMSTHLIINERAEVNLLPTERLLHNILKVHHDQFVLNEEVLRCPAVMPRNKSISEQNARQELKAWLSAEHEQSPIKQLWLMGSTAHRFFIEDSAETAVFIQKKLNDVNVNAALLPSLQTLLTEPAAKAALFQFLIGCKHE